MRYLALCLALVSCGDLEISTSDRTPACASLVQEPCSDVYDTRFGVGAIVGAEVYAGLTRFETASPHELSAMQWVRVSGSTYFGEYRVRASGLDAAHFAVPATFTGMAAGTFRANEIGADYVKIPAGLGEGAYRVDYDGVLAGQPYDLDVLVQGRDDWDTDVVTIGVEWYSADGDLLGIETVHEGVLPYGQAWIHLSGTVTPPAGSMKASALVLKSTGGDHPLDLYVDHLELSLQGCATP